MAAGLAQQHKVGFLQSANDARSGNLGKVRHQAAMSLINTSRFSSFRLSSLRDHKKSWMAFLMFFVASATVSPWLAQPGSSGAYTEYPPVGSFSIIILCLTAFFLLTIISLNEEFGGKFRRKHNTPLPTRQILHAVQPDMRKILGSIGTNGGSTRRKFFAQIGGLLLGSQLLPGEIERFKRQPEDLAWQAFRWHGDPARTHACQTLLLELTGVKDSVPSDPEILREIISQSGKLETLLLETAPSSNLDAGLFQLYTRLCLYDESRHLRPAHLLYGLVSKQSKRLDPKPELTKWIQDQTQWLETNGTALQLSTEEEYRLSEAETADLAHGIVLIRVELTKLANRDSFSWRSLFGFVGLAAALGGLLVWRRSRIQKIPPTLGLIATLTVGAAALYAVQGGWGRWGILASMLLGNT